MSGLSLTSARPVAAGRCTGDAGAMTNPTPDDDEHEFRVAVSSALNRIADALEAANANLTKIESHLGEQWKRTAAVAVAVENLAKKCKGS